MLCWKAIRARLVAMQSPTRRLWVRHEPQHNIDLSHVTTNHSPARHAKRVFLVTAIRPHGVRSQTLMLAGLNGELILFEFMLGFILHPNLRAGAPSAAALRAVWILWRLRQFTAGEMPERIDGAIAMALTFILWFCIPPLIVLTRGGL